MGPKPKDVWKSQNARDDFFSWSEDELLASSIFDGSIITLDVMSNDSGNNNSLFSIDDGPNGIGNFLEDMLENDITTDWELTEFGNQIRIVNGKVEFDISNALIDLGGDINGLAAGETLVDSFTYAIQLGNGKLSWATVDIQIVGDNDAPVIVSGGGGDNAMVAIDEGTTAVMTVAADDPDVSNTLLYSISGGADQALFEIDSVTGELSFNAAPDFELPGDAGADNFYDVQVQVDDGTVTDTQDIAVEVKDVFEPALLVVAYTNNDGIDGFDPVLDTLISAIYDSNGDGVISVGDAVELGTYPKDLAALETGVFGDPSHSVSATTEFNSGSFILVGVDHPVTGDRFDFVWQADDRLETFALADNSVLDVGFRVLDSLTVEKNDDIGILGNPIGDPEGPIFVSALQPGDNIFVDVDIFV